MIAPLIIFPHKSPCWRRDRADPPERCAEGARQAGRRGVARARRPRKLRTVKPPIRMVCGDCLQSVEIALDDSGLLPTIATCPYCGGTIDSRLSELGTQSADPAAP